MEQKLVKLLRHKVVAIVSRTTCLCSHAVTDYCVFHASIDCLGRLVFEQKELIVHGDFCTRQSFKKE